MKNKLYTLLIIVIVAAMLLSACQTPSPASSGLDSTSDSDITPHDDDDAPQAYKHDSENILSQSALRQRTTSTLSAYRPVALSSTVENTLKTALGSVSLRAWISRTTGVWGMLTCPISAA